MNARVKGLEPIVAAVLLIVVAVIGAVLVYLWFAGYVTKAASQAERASIQEKIKIEAANLITTGVYAYVRNIGDIQVAVSSLYVLNGTTGQLICKPSISSTTIAPGDAQLIESTLSNCRITSGNPYVIKVVTTKGTEAAITVIAG